MFFVIWMSFVFNVCPFVRLNIVSYFYFACMSYLYLYFYYCSLFYFYFYFLLGPCLLCHEKRAIKQPTWRPPSLLPGTWRSIGGGITFLGERKDQRLAYKKRKKQAHKGLEKTRRSTAKTAPKLKSNPVIAQPPISVRPTPFSIRPTVSLRYMVSPCMNVILPWALLAWYMFLNNELAWCWARKRL